MSIGKYFSLVNVQAIMALRAEAARYYLGYMWWVFEPLMYVAVFYLVFAVALKTEIDDFLVFLVCGKFTFVWFSQSVNKSAERLLYAKSLIGKLNAPKSLFPMAAVQEGLYIQAAVFILLFLVVIIHGYWPTLTWFWLVPLMAVNYLLIVACSLIGAFIVCLIPDFSRVIALGTVFLMLTSGIFWDVRDITDPETFEFVLWINPIAFLIDAYRQILMHNQTPDWHHLLAIALFFGVLLAGIGWVYRRYSQFIALKVLTA